jgi:hypothetical protein
MKKILVFGLPRTGSTIIQQYLAHKFNIKNYSEPLSQKLPDFMDNPYKWASNLSSGVIKILSVNLLEVDFIKFVTTGQFDSIVVTHRENLVDSCVSLFYAEMIQKYHFKQLPTNEEIKKFTCPLSFVYTWLDQYKEYQNILKYFDDNSISYQLINYDNFLSENYKIFKLNNAKAFNTITSNIPYAKLCINYNEVVKIFNEEIK